MHRLIAIILACASLSACPSESAHLDPSLRQLVSTDLWEASNHGRVPLRNDGYFDFPDEVERVIIDVGAYKLRVTWPYMWKDPNLAIVAIEPMEKPWQDWPDDPKIIGLPVAISLERGTLDFHVNKREETSSVLESVPGGLLSSETVELRRVPSVRLEDILERIPPDLAITFLKSDTQGMDLAVLMSAGDELRRVKQVMTEVVADPSYKKGGAGSMGSEKEFDDYMKSMGFSRGKAASRGGRFFANVYYDNDHWKDKS